MMDWAIWFVLAGLVIVAELFTGTFYLLMIAIGLIAGGAVALLGGSLEWQLLAAAAVGFIATGLLRRSRFGKHKKILLRAIPMYCWISVRASGSITGRRKTASAWRGYRIAAQTGTSSWKPAARRQQGILSFVKYAAVG